MGNSDTRLTPDPEVGSRSPEFVCFFGELPRFGQVSRI